MTRRKRGALLAAVIAVTAVATATAALAGGSASSFTTTVDPMLSCPSCGADVIPIITVGEELASGYRFEAIPDGVSVHARGDDDDEGGRFDLYINHETSTVPFPFNAPFGATPPNEANQNDFDNSQVSRLTLNRNNEIVRAEMVIRSSSNFHRFCSNYLATRKEGFDRPMLFTNEEAQDWVFRSGTSWAGPSFIPPGTTGAEQTGVVVAYDVRRGAHRPIYGMGRFNHENNIAVPGDDDVMVLSGDDTFSTTPASSQVYMYVAKNRRALWNDQGTLYALAAVDSDVDNDYFDVQPGDAPVAMEFIPVPKTIATGKKAGGVDITQAADFPTYPAPPSSIPDGPQWVLDQWGNKANNAFGKDVFDFIRIEDTAYDKRRGMSNVIYMADSGRGTAPAPPAPSFNPLSVSTNGRVWKLELDKNDPLKATLSVLIQGDDNPVKTLTEIRQPDNVETTAAGSLLIQEDPGSSQQFSASDPAGVTARIWRYDLNAASSPANPAPVASVNQELDENQDSTMGPIDVDGTGVQEPPADFPGNQGAWESSGIVDASSVLGRGWFFVTIQAHTYWVQKTDGPDAINPPAGKDYTFKREGGQLLAIRIPGA